jgi:hypothetical protein
MSQLRAHLEDSQLLVIAEDDQRLESSVVCFPSVRAVRVVI